MHACTGRLSVCWVLVSLPHLSHIIFKMHRCFRFAVRIQKTSGLEVVEPNLHISNGTGKTTFAQAFFWCLYGDTEFTDKVIINRITANKLAPQESAKVIVELRLWHGDNFYTLTREQEYTKNTNGSVKGAIAVFASCRSNGIQPQHCRQSSCFR